MSSPPNLRVVPVSVRRQLRWEGPASSRHTDPGYSQGALALTYPLPGGLEAEPRADALTVVRSAPGEGAPIPCPESWAARFLQAVIEVVSCDRPVTQLVRWTDRFVYADIARRQQLVAAHRSPTTVRSCRQHVASVHVCRLTPDVAEVAARIAFGPRSRAIAARLEHRRGRWLCTALCFG
jgi:hypothetical protein